MKQLLEQNYRTNHGICDWKYFHRVFVRWSFNFLRSSKFSSVNYCHLCMYIWADSVELGAQTLLAVTESVFICFPIHCRKTMIHNTRYTRCSFPKGSWLINTLDQTIYTVKFLWRMYSGARIIRTKIPENYFVRIKQNVWIILTSKSMWNQWGSIQLFH